MKQIRHWHVYSDVDSLKQAIVGDIKKYSDHCLKTKGDFYIVLAGGNTPKKIYQALCHIKTDWSAWHIYFGDERCLPLGDAQRNDSMARQNWLDHVPIPGNQIHAIPAELGNEAGARSYRNILVDVNDFDLVLLGLGEDGHTASLFPGQEVDHEVDVPDVLAIKNAPKPPPERISLSAKRLSQANHVWFVVTGEGKSHALQNWQQDKNIPANWIRPQQGIDIYTDLGVPNSSPPS